jgi:HEAT repeat protein
MEVRRMAALALGDVRSPIAALPLTHALSDRSPEVKAAAARALGRINGVGAAPALKDAMRREPDPAFQAQAARALMKLRAAAE